MKSLPNVADGVEVDLEFDRQGFDRFTSLQSPSNLSLLLDRQPIVAALPCIRNSFVTHIRQYRRNCNKKVKSYLSQCQKMLVMASTGIGEKIALARKYARPALTQHGLASKIGVNRSTLAQYEAGRTEPPAGLVKRIAEAIGLPLEWFYSDSADPTELSVKLVDNVLPSGPSRYTLGALVALPLWRAVLAGEEEEMSFTEGVEVALEEVPAFLLAGPAEEHRVIEVAGGSMAPRLAHSDRAIVRLTDRPPLHTLVVVKSPEGQMFVKVLRPAEPPLPFELHPLADRYPIIKRVSGWQFVGCVIAILKSAPPGEPNIEWNGGAPLKG